MSALKERLQADLSAAIKSRDELRTRTLRLALAAVRSEEVAGKQVRELPDDEIVTVLTREKKKRREAAEAYEGGGRGDQAAAEQAEADVLEAYLPQQLTDAELAELAAAAITEVGATNQKDMGQAMKVLNPRVAGRAEGARVAAEVRRQLSS